MPPVTYVFLSTTFSQIRSTASASSWSPVSAATSAAPAYRYIARTECPTASSCSTSGLWSWLYSPNSFGRSSVWLPRSSTKYFASVEIVAVARRPIKLHQPELDLRMPGRNLHLAGTERFHQQVGALGGHVEKVLLPRRLVVCGCRFVHVAEVVELVAHFLFDPFLLLRIAADDVGRVVDLVAGGPGGVEVAVIFLRRRPCSRSPRRRKPPAADRDASSTSRMLLR